MNEKCLNVNTVNTLNAIDMEKVATLQLQGDVAQIQTADETMPVVASYMKLPSAEEYSRMDADYVQSYFDWSIKKWSEPKYICPKCNEGGMCRDETTILTSIPPKHRYECNKCHHVDYHSI